MTVITPLGSGYAINFFRDSVVISDGDFTIPCECGRLESEHDDLDEKECYEYEPDLEMAEQMYSEDNAFHRNIDHNGRKLWRALSATEAARIIDVELGKWEGNCHWIATKFVDHAEALGLPEGVRVSRGHWIGPISLRSSSFGGRRMAQHSWVTTLDGTIIDPTRFAFEGLPSYVWSGKDDDGWYDEGSNKIRVALMGDTPYPEFKNEHIAIGFGSAQEHVESLGAVGPYDFGRLMWLSNLNINLLAEHANVIYTAIEDAGWAALIPMDNRALALIPMEAWVK